MAESATTTAHDRTPLKESEIDWKISVARQASVVSAIQS